MTYAVASFQTLSSCRIEPPAALDPYQYPPEPTFGKRPLTPAPGNGQRSLLFAWCLAHSTWQSCVSSPPLRRVPDPQVPVMCSGPIAPPPLAGNYLSKPHGPLTLHSLLCDKGGGGAHA